MTTATIYLALILLVGWLLTVAWRAVTQAGANAESLKQSKAVIDAKVDELEMHREATEIERDNVALSDAEARAKAKRVVR